MPTLEALIARVDDHSRRLNSHDDEFKSVYKVLHGKVDYRTFMLIFTIMCGILGIMFYIQLDIQKKVSVTAEQVAAIVGYGIEVKNN